MKWEGFNVVHVYVTGCSGDSHTFADILASLPLDDMLVKCRI